MTLEFTNNILNHTYTLHDILVWAQVYNIFLICAIAKVIGIKPCLCRITITRYKIHT